MQSLPQKSLRLLKAKLSSILVVADSVPILRIVENSVEPLSLKMTMTLRM
jgi:hypothetical protein